MADGPRRSAFNPVAVMATLITLLIATAIPAAADDWETCNNKFDGRDITCSRAITSGKFTGRDLATLYYNRAAIYQADLDRAIADYNEAIKADPEFAFPYNARGNAYRAKGEYDLAIADYNEAIRLLPRFEAAYLSRGAAWQATGDYDRAIADATKVIEIEPGFVNAYTNRGDVYKAKGEYDRAIADYNEAILLYRTPGSGRFMILMSVSPTRLVEGKPSMDYAYSNRGRLFLYGGSLDKALADFKQANELDPKYAYAALWLDIAERRSNTPSHLAQASKQLDMTSWPAPVVRLFLGELSPAQTLAAADDNDPKTKQARVCQANFYSGELALLQGAKNEAIRLFQLAASDCRQNSFVRNRRG